MEHTVFSTAYLLKPSSVTVIFNIKVILGLSYVWDGGNKKCIQTVGDEIFWKVATYRIKKKMGG